MGDAEDNAGDLAEDVGELSLSEKSEAASKKSKIEILLKATGNAPIVKKKKWLVEQDRTIGSVLNFFRRYLKLDPAESLFLYVNQSFAPAPDQIIQNLYDCFGSDGKLVLHYCKTQAWG
ncbi:unnamed protein product [Bemisia tabaci]|uniref:Ubiquitin-like protein ATG12 n=1 Tax=Bemisia tabaci TaxID=7038 RepID=A0A9P0A5B1_BEMTA|nr:PREDICTED: autophagy protein 12-like [Bemisia tabaci]XP_018901918.1 PREDICTED: autophagy protein 12-like [Bemisia tabaci]XP_018901919.1 PREDICTED: autophagy protein 12-like [Bemisia tabaci]CAH0384209.1 unnamed protein product [Bemisia tabaci]